MDVARLDDGAADRDVSGTDRLRRPERPDTSGLVEPRTAYPKLRTSRIPWGGRDEDKDDDGVWAVADPGKEITWGEMHVGARQVFEEAGFTEITLPTARRVVMRIDFE